MRPSDIIVYLQINGVLLSYLLTDVPGIDETRWTIFLFSGDYGTRIIRCTGPMTNDECNFLKSNRVYGVLTHNNLCYKLLDCRSNSFNHYDLSPPCVGVISKIKPRRLDWYSEFSLDVWGTLERIPSIEFGLRRQ